MVRFVEHDEDLDGEHAFRSFDCLPSSGDQQLVEDLAEIVKSLYIDADQLRTLAEAAGEDLDSVADPELTERLVQEMTSSSIPVQGQAGVPPPLDVTRSELAEVLAMELAKAEFDTLIPAARVTHKEIPQLASRGIDLIGFEETDRLRLVIGETKASDEEASPPGVVEGSKTSLREQLLASIADSPRLLWELNWCLKHSDEMHQLTIVRAGLLLVAGDLEFVIYPVLVRSQERHKEGDCGTFRESPQDFTPGAVRFCIIRLTQPVDDLAADVYSNARSVA